MTGQEIKLNAGMACTEDRGSLRRRRTVHTTKTADGEGGMTGPMKLSTQTRGVQSTARDVCVASAPQRSDATPARVEQTDNANTDENPF